MGLESFPNVEMVTFNMKFSQINTNPRIYILFILIIFNIILRVPIYINYVGSFDSDVAIYDLMAESILMEGSAKWLLHPASPFGLSQYSYPSFAALFLALISSITELTKLDLLLWVSFVFGIFGVIFGYLLGYAYSGGNSTIAFFTALAFSVNTLFVEYSKIGSTSRALYFLLSALSLYLFFRYNGNKNNKYSILFLIVMFAGIATHRLYVILILILFFSHVFTNMYIRPIKISYVSHLTAIKLYEGPLFIIAFFVIYLFTFTSYYPLSNNHAYLQHGIFFSGNSLVIMFLNMVIDYIVALNPFVLLISVIGILIIINNKKKQKNDLFLVFFLLICTLIISNSYYTSNLVIFVTTIIFAVSMNNFMMDIQHTRHKQLFCILVILLVTSFALFISTPIESMIFHKERLQDESANIGMLQTAKYISDLDGDIKTDSHFVSRILMLYGQKPVFPFTGPEYPIYYNDLYKNINFNIHPKKYIESNFYYMWYLDKPVDINPDIIYVHTTKGYYNNKMANKIFANKGEIIYEI